VIDATVRRARPILLTAGTAIFAMIPLSRSVFWGPMAVALMGGLLVATALTLLFPSALYAAWFRVRQPAAKPALVEAIRRSPSPRSRIRDKVGSPEGESRGPVCVCAQDRPAVVGVEGGATPGPATAAGLWREQVLHGRPNSSGMPQMPTAAPPPRLGLRCLLAVG
jgi:hypothetical protein